MSRNNGEQHSSVLLNKFDNSDFDRGASSLKEALWIFIQALFVSSWIPGSSHRKLLLRLFGARIGKNVVLKPRIRVKFPWRLEIGAYSWIGESCWIDNLATTKIGQHCCISQGVSICTGNHDRHSQFFDLLTQPVVISDYAWVAAYAQIGPGVNIGEGAMLCLGGVAHNDLQAWSIYSGNPCQYILARKIH